MTEGDAFVMLELRKFEAQCLNARMAVGRARTLAEVRRAGHVSPPAIIQSLVSSLADYRALEAETELRARQIVLEQVDCLRAASTTELNDAERDFRRNVLRELRGDLANLYRWAERELILVLRNRDPR